MTAVPVAGGSNHPGVDLKADGEVMLDVEIIGAVAPRAHQRVYFAKNTDAGFLAAVKAALHDPIQPIAISISWGSAESKWTAQAMQAMEGAFKDAATLGIPTVASGDDGSFDGTSALAADFPTSAPHALGCGGTHLQGNGSTITSETVWNSGTAAGSTGGGVSTVFAKPSYQSSTAVPPSRGGTGGRGVPDVCGNAAAESPYKVFVNGAAAVSWGTSAVAPLWAELVVRIGQKVGRPVGFLHTLLYQPGGQRLRTARCHGRQQRHQRRQRALYGRARLGRLHRTGQPHRFRLADGHPGLEPAGAGLQDAAFGQDEVEMVVLRLPRWSGIPCARNRGAEMARHPILVITDGNARFPQEWNESIWRHMRPRRILCATIVDMESPFRRYGCGKDTAFFKCCTASTPHWKCGRAFERRMRRAVGTICAVCAWPARQIHRF